MPAELDADRATTLWQLAADLYDENGTDKRRDAYHIIGKLTNEWIVVQDDLIRDIEADIWDRIGDADDGDEHYGTWLQMLRAARGIR